MRKIFIDTNILLDVILHRADFYQQAAAIWADCESRKVQGYVSAISLNNMHYIMRKMVAPDVALEYVRLVLNVFSIVPLDESILRLAVDLPQKDFEDAIQTFSAVQIKADCIVTRDKSHFSNHYMPVISPIEYVDFFQ
ncbi:MAG: PIN domain-containing protein [Victivallales bacterium]|nr:PIN domain-containing protein [Victivallales bacterium]